MIFVQTILRVSDNSGAKKVRCIKILGGFRRQYAKCGDLIVVSVQKVKFHKKTKIKIKEGDVVRAVIVRTANKTFRKNKTDFVFAENAVVLLTPKKKPYASRVLGSVAKELRFSKYMKIASLASGLV